MMQWTDTCNKVVDRTDTGIRSHAQLYAGDGSTMEYDLHHASVFAASVTIDGVGVSSRSFKVTEEGGSTGGDILAFVTRYVEGLGVGDTVTTDFDLARDDTQEHEVYVNRVLQTLATDYTIGVGTGPGGVDQVLFTAAPGLGVIITCRYEVEGPPALGAVISIKYMWRAAPRGPFLTSRRPLDLPESYEDYWIITSGYESLWMIAGRTDVYGDPHMWWALVDCNEGLNNVFAAMFTLLPQGLHIRVPPMSRIQEALNV